MIWNLLVKTQPSEPTIGQMHAHFIQQTPFARDPVEVMGHNTGYYEIKHIESGKILRTYHKDDEWKVQ